MESYTRGAVRSNQDQKHQTIRIHNKHLEQKNKTIDKIMNFNSEISVKLDFGIFEKLIHKSIDIPKSYMLRADDYLELKFEELMNQANFLPEYKAIKEIANKFLKEQKNINNPYFWFYSKICSLPGPRARMRYPRHIFCLIPLLPFRL